MTIISIPVKLKQRAANKTDEERAALFAAMEEALIMSLSLMCLCHRDPTFHDSSAVEG